MPFPVFIVASLSIAAATMAATGWLAQRGRLPLAIAAALTGATALVLFHGLGYLNMVVDDAYINFRYSRHLADGLGPNWNSEGRVEGYTNFLWMALLAGFAKIGLDIVVWSRVLGGLALAATMFATYRIWQLWRDDDEGSGVESPLVLAAALLGLGLTGGVAHFAFSGLETPLFMALITTSAYLYFIEHRRGGRLPWSAVALAAAAMARPDGLIAVAVTGVFKLRLLFQPPERQKQAVIDIAFWAGVFLLLYGSYFIWRFAYYDYLLPNTFYAKVEPSTAVFNRGLEYLRGIGARYQLLPMLIGGTVLLLSRPRLRHDAAYVIAVCGFMLAAIVPEGGDFMGHGRFLVPTLPLLYLSGLAGFATLLKRAAPQPAQARLVASLFLGLAALALLQNSYDPLLGQERSSYRERRLLGAWLNEHTPPDYTIAAYAVGALGYYAHDRSILDMLGINDTVIAHTETPRIGEGVPGHERYNLDYVFEEVRPEIIIGGEFAPGPQTKEDFQQEASEEVYVPLRRVLLVDPRLWANYEVRWLVVGDRWVNLLVRNDVLAELQGAGLIGDQNFLRSSGSSGFDGWTAWRSTLQPSENSTLVLSNESAYGVAQRTVEADLQPAQGQRYVALVWVKGTGSSAGGQFSLSLRENGLHSPETESNGFFSLAPDWQPIWVERTIEQPDVTFLSVHLIKFSEAAQNDAFLFRDAQLQMVSGEPEGNVSASR